MIARLTDLEKDDWILKRYIFTFATALEAKKRSGIYIYTMNVNSIQMGYSESLQLNIPAML